MSSGIWCGRPPLNPLVKGDVFLAIPIQFSLRSEIPMMNNDAFNLSMEQKFQLQCLQQEYQDLDREQTVNFLLETMQQIMVRDNLIRDLMKKSLFS